MKSMRSFTASDTVIVSAFLIRNTGRGTRVEEEIVKVLQEPVTVVMIPCPPAVHPDTPVTRVLEQFSRTGHPMLVVGTDGSFAGVITPGDLISVISPGNGPKKRYIISGLDRFLKSTAQNARDLMSDEPLTVPATARISDALQAMEHGHATSVILLDEKNMAVGCVELSGIIAYLIRSLPR